MLNPNFKPSISIRGTENPTSFFTDTKKIIQTIGVPRFFGTSLRLSLILIAILQKVCELYSEAGQVTSHGPYLVLHFGQSDK